MSALRILFGFGLACFAASVVTVCFVNSPLEIAELAGIPMLEKIRESFELALRVTTHSAIFAAPFAFLAVLVGEWAHIRNWLYYATMGMAIAALGFSLQFASEVSDQRTILNSNAVLAFLLSGFVGGVTYWLFSGRRAGGYRADPEFDYHPQGQESSFKVSESGQQREATAEIRHSDASKTPPTPPVQNEPKQNLEKRQDRATSVPVTKPH